MKDAADLLRAIVGDVYLSGRYIEFGSVSLTAQQFATIARLQAEEKVQGEDGTPLNPEAIKQFQQVFRPEPKLGGGQFVDPDGPLAPRINGAA